jgi:hypothetical protein
MQPSQFNTRPTKEFRDVVAHLSTLTPTQQNQAFAEAHAERLKEGVASWLGQKASGIKSWKRLFGQSVRADDCLPGDDHVELWTGEKGFSYVSHPYDLTFETVQSMVEFAQENGLEFSLSGTSWYYPGRTMRVICAGGQQRFLRVRSRRPRSKY